MGIFKKLAGGDKDRPDGGKIAVWAGIDDLA